MNIDLPTLKLVTRAMLDSNEQKIQRLDPSGCGCTDCLTGYSRPIDQVSDHLVLLMLMGAVINATSVTDFTVTVTLHSAFDTPTTVTGFDLQREGY